MSLMTVAISHEANFSRRMEPRRSGDLEGACRRTQHRSSSVRRTRSTPRRRCDRAVRCVRLSIGLRRARPGLKGRLRLSIHRVQLSLQTQVIRPARSLKSAGRFAYRGSGTSSSVCEMFRATLAVCPVPLSGLSRTLSVEAASAVGHRSQSTLERGARCAVCPTAGCDSREPGALASPVASPFW
jgi:hypothetical protein